MIWIELTGLLISGLVLIVICSYLTGHKNTILFAFGRILSAFCGVFSIGVLSVTINDPVENTVANWIAMIVGGVFLLVFSVFVLVNRRDLRWPTN